MGLADKLFGSYSAKELKRIRPQVDAVLALEDHYRRMDNKTLQGETARFKEQLAAGKTLDDILPEAFAACREAADRVLGMRHFPVQVMGGIILHQGRIAEMKTGEGKTLVATLPAYLNALSGKGVHVVTVNEYLARRDSEWMGNLYRWMGLTVGLAVSGMSPDQKRAAYAADITYGTNNEFGFDYLRDNMVVYKRNCVQRGWNYAIVDEVDSILIDEARTPLIISGAGEKSTDLYEKADRFAATLTPLRVKEMDAKDDVMHSHDVIDRIERDLLVEDGLIATIHFDPIVTGNPHADELKEFLQNEVQELEPLANIHDLRIVPGPTHTNVIFDCAVPAEYMTDKQHRGVKLVNALRNSVQAKWPDHFCVIKLEPDYAPAHHKDK